MKKVLFTALIATVAVAANAQVTVGTPVVFNVGAVASAPQGVAITNNEIYFAGFNNRVIAKISDPLGTPVTSTAADLTSTNAWVASRGIQDLDVVGTTIYAFGDNGSGNLAVVVPFDVTTQTAGTAVSISGNRICGGFAVSGTQFYVGRADASQIQAVDGALAQTGVTAGTSLTGFTAPVRDIELVGNNLFYLSGATTAGVPHTIGKYTPVTAAADLATATFSGFYTPAATAASGSRNHIGLAQYTQGATTYLVMPQSNGTNGSIAFIDSTNSATVTTVGATELAGKQLTGISVGQIGTKTYVAVASQNGGTNPNEIYLFEITSATSASVENWTSY